jgi:glycosyltransferase involved in cell wall biosynthesis
LTHLVVIETHSVQYHAPVYRCLEQGCGVKVTAVYGSDFSLAGYRDQEFGADFAWDTDLLSGYRSVFLSKVDQGGARSAEETRARGLKRVLKELRPAAILLLGYSPRFYRQALLQARRLGCPLLFRAETTDHAQKRGRWRSWLRDRLLKVLYHRCSRLLYIGERSRQHYLRLGCPESKLVFSPYCVDTAPFRFTESDRERYRGPIRQALDIAPDQKAVLFSGKLSARKGVDLLIQAVQRLPESLRREVVVVFLGSGEMQYELERLAGTNCRVAVRFTGFQNQSRLSAYYHAADLLALPSLHSETWGLVVNEALYHGVPAVVSDQVGCAPDLVIPGQTGEVYRSESVEELAAALQRGLGLSGRDEVRDVCRERVARYSVRAAAEGIAQAFWECTTQNRSASEALASASG